MTPPPPQRRRRGTGAVAARPRKVGGVRRSQMVTTYGVGAMIAVDNESFVVAGLDTWDVSEAPEVLERRLARILRVRAFRQPPAPDPDRGKDGVRVRRFPEWYSCPKCSVLQPFFKFNSPPRAARCGECEEELVPSRFVLACNNGHIADFPYWRWVHRGSGHAGGLCGGTLSLRTNGSTASLRSVVVACSCGVPEVSMEGAFRSRVLRDLGIRCEGRRPWLKDAPVEACDQVPRAMQRGSSAVWHPLVASALSIPPWGEGLHKLVEKHKLIGASEDTVRWFAKHHPAVLKSVDATVDDVIDLVRAVEEEDAKAAEDDIPAPRAHSALRQEEYIRLVRGNPERYAAEWQPFVCEKPQGTPDALRSLGLYDTMLVKRLREVRALASFMRGDLPSEADSERRKASLALSDDIDWLPATEVIGEGVFVRLDADRLRAWEAEPAVAARAQRIRDSHLTQLRRRASTPAGPVARRSEEPDSPVSPRYLLLHTLAHILINEWSLDGGYPTSALRERLYCGDDMAGTLLYTATSDSAGSLGGIVAQGEPDRLVHTLKAALARAAWCSNDPLCMESEAAGVDNVNLAACHACVLLPETSCETNNSFLDRALLIGTPTGSVPGFFQGAV
ncbi:DrmB family protein [Streptomyces sp. NPDC053542]|uniref:DrmB family protein n=1 Tax=Streptomyces sp. NPDC053542 TaxID=3365710 RepID=UPI0037CF48EA